MANDVRVAVDRLDSPVGAALAKFLLDELMVRYGAEDEPDRLSADQLAPPSGAFLVAWNADEAIGCGGFRRVDDDIAEIKRMFVIPDARRAGVARMVLNEIETRATEVGYARLILETGTMQPEAMRLYETHGYEPIAPFGPYADSPMSRCYGKSL